MTFKDHFSGHAADYARHRPTYPRALFAWLAEHAPGRRQAWDCATGNGQAAVALAEQFEHVVATDASGEQIASAVHHPRVTYECAPAEATSLAAGSCDLITVAQALHWFDRDAFYCEVERVACPGALIAAWMYNLLRVEPAIDAIVHRFMEQTVGSYWPPERELLDGSYSAIEFPFVEVPPPAMAIEVEWSVAQVLRYIATWSAVRRFRSERGEDPVTALAAELEPAWGGGLRRVCWPLVVLAGRVDSRD